MSERADAVRRLILKKHDKGMTYDRIIKWLKGLKYEFDCEWNDFIDTSIKQVKGGVYYDVIAGELFDPRAKGDDSMEEGCTKETLCQLGLFDGRGS